MVEGNITADGYKSMGSVRRGDYIYKTESKYSVIRAGKINIDGVPADGSSKADDALMESIEPFNYSDLVKFALSFGALCGKIRRFKGHGIRTSTKKNDRRRQR